MIMALVMVTLMVASVAFYFWRAERALRFGGSMRELGLSSVEARRGVAVRDRAKLWTGTREGREVRGWTVQDGPPMLVPPRFLLAVRLRSTEMGWQLESGEREPIPFNALGPAMDLMTRSTDELDAPRYLPSIGMELSVAATRSAAADARLVEPTVVKAIQQLQERASLGIWDEVIVTMLANSPTTEEINRVLDQMLELAERLEPAR